MKNALLGSVILVCASIASAGVVSSATFVANWNGDTGNNGLDANYSLGGVGALSVEGTPGPGVIASGMNGTNSINLTDVSPKTTSANNPSLAYSAQNVVNSNAGTVMLWLRHGTVPADDEMRYFYAQFPQSGGTDGFISFTKHSSDSLDRLYLTVRDASGFQYLYIDGGWSAINDKAYHHLAITWDNATGAVGMYIHDANGNLQLSKTDVLSSWTMPAMASDSTFFIADNDFHARGANGVLDDYAISSKSLTLGEIETAMTGEAVVPEPATMAVLAIGSVMMLKTSRRKFSEKE